MRRSVFLIFSLILVVACSVVPGARAAADPDYSQIIASEASWITSAQIPAGHGDASGAIPISNDPSNGEWDVKPYDANIAAWGLLANGTTDAPQVKAWMQWYFNHLNWPDYNGVYATIYDYYINDTTYAVTPVPDGSSGHAFYDSTDSYAATFLTLCRAYAQTTGDYSFLQSNQYQINQIIGAIMATKQSDGLTWAKPDYQGKLLMDNSEVYSGLSDAAWLYQNVFTDDPSGYSYYAAEANDVKTGILTYLWDAHTPNMFSTIKGSDGSTDTVSWSNWYPDATSQLWPIKAGIVSGSEATSLWDTFDATWPNWVTTVNNPDGMPWGAIGYTAAFMGDKTDADSFLANADTNYMANGNPWPWSAREAGFTMQAAKLDSQLP